MLISAEELQKRVKELAQEISRDYAGRELLMVGVLKGSFMFMADLIRYLDCDVEVDFMGTVSYGASTESSGKYGLRKTSNRVWQDATSSWLKTLDTGLPDTSDTLRNRQPASPKCAHFSMSARRRVSQFDYYGS